MVEINVNKEKAFMFRTYITTVLLVFGLTSNISAQGVESELGFIFTKAKYLLDTDRFDGAIKELTKIINKDPQFEDVLLQRAKAKYAVGAFAGAKKDLANYIGYKGISDEVVLLNANVEYSMQNYEAAINSFTVASSLNPKDEKIMEKLGGLYYDEGKDELACKYWKKAAQLGSMRARKLSSKNCGNYSNNDFEEKKSKPKYDDGPAMIEEEGDDEPTDDTVVLSEKIENSDDDVVEDDDVKDDMKEEEEKETPPVDDVLRTIEVDEDLSLKIFGEGLGSRRILNEPNILILSDDSGKVAINICVNRNGKVVSAEYDPAKSTITKESLISLASRKAKEFWFEKSRTKEACGYIVFDITGS